MWQQMASMARCMGAVHPSFKGFKSGVCLLTCMGLAEMLCVLCRDLRDKSCI